MAMKRLWANIPDGKPTDILKNEDSIVDNLNDGTGANNEATDIDKISFGEEEIVQSNNSDKEPEDFFFDMGTVKLLNNTTIYFNCIVEKNTVDRAMELFRVVNNNIAAIVQEYPELKGQLVPKFIINSNGGSIVQGLRLFDKIKENMYPVTTIVNGMAASMGIILAVAGSKKQATKHSVLMIHSLSAGASGKYRELMDYAKFWTQLQDVLSKIIVDNTKAKKEDVDDLMQGESFILATDALQMGLIDEIVSI